METKRLNKAISETGFTSRRGADRLIESGVVKVNGEVAGLGVKVVPTDVITVNDQIITKEVEPIYLAFNKPMGITCTTDRAIPGNIVDFINYPERIFPIGRLDKPSQGLIFMTNDGDIVNKILRSKNNHEKEYLVKVDYPIDDRFLEDMAKGVPILDTVTKPCKVTRVSEYTFKIVLTQGLNRQIRRMCSYLDFEVVTLKRTRIMNISLDGIQVGTYRSFTEQELTDVLALCEDSIMTEEGSI
jgi:23S rRNA pseudouridine2604 synthase